MRGDIDGTRLKAGTEAKDGKLQKVEWEPNPKLIKHIEMLLEYAKTGELRGMVEVLMWQGERVSTAFRGGHQENDYALWGSAVIGELQILKTKLTMLQLERREELPGIDISIFPPEDPPDESA